MLVSWQIQGLVVGTAGQPVRNLRAVGYLKG